VKNGRTNPRRAGQSACAPCAQRIAAGTRLRNDLRRRAKTKRQERKSAAFGAARALRPPGFAAAAFTAASCRCCRCRERQRQGVDVGREALGLVDVDDLLLEQLDEVLVEALAAASLLPTVPLRLVEFAVEGCTSGTSGVFIMISITARALAVALSSRVADR
jgi:hypothetical protein